MVPVTEFFNAISPTQLNDSFTVLHNHPIIDWLFAISHIGNGWHCFNISVTLFLLFLVDKHEKMCGCLI